MAITMYDSVNPTELPRDAEAVAGYVNGKWPTYWTLVTDFAHTHKLSIDVLGNGDAECLDVEKGDATPIQAPPWVKRQIARGVVRPVVYANRSTMPAVISALRAAGIRRRTVRLFVADYTYRPHLPIMRWGLLPTRADACQWTDRALGRNLDASLCSANFFGVPAKPLTRRQLRAKILGWHKHGVPWRRIKATRVWRLYRILRGR